MANDKHFRIKNGLKVGDTEVVNESGQITASAISIGGEILPTLITSQSDTLSSLSAALGTYADAESTNTLIEQLKLTASGHKVSASSSAAATSLSLSAATLAKNSTSDAKVATEGFRDLASTYKLSASASKSAALVSAGLALGHQVTASSHKLSASSAKDFALSSKSAANCAKLSASASRSSALASTSDALASKVSASSSLSATEVAKLLAVSAKNLTISSKSAANLAKLSASASKSAASAAKSSALASENVAVSAKNIAVSARNVTTGAQATASSANSSALASQVSASGAAAVAVSAKNIAVSARNVTTGAQATASSANSSTLVSQVSASGAAVSANSSKTLALQAKNAAEGFEATASAANSATLVSEASASGAAVSANSSKTLALQAKNATTGFQATASAANSSALASKVTASSAAVSANSSKTLALQAKNAAEGFEATASAANSSALVSKVTASSAAVSANSSKTLALQAKNATTGFESTASAANSATLVSQVTASGAAAVSISARDVALSAKNATTGYESSASASNSATLLSKAGASNAKAAAISAKNIAVSARNVATGAQATASAANSSALVSEASASGAVVAANSSKTLALQAKNAAEGFEATASAANSATLVSEASASGALVATNSSKAAALIAKNATTGFQATASAANSSALASKVTASSAAVSANSSKTLALQAKNAAEGFESTASASNSATLVSKASASSAASVAVSAKNIAVSARNVTTGAQATASAANSSALASKVTASSAAVSANSSKTLALQAKNATTGFQATASAANSATLVSEASASGAAVSANSSKTLALQAKNATTGFQATASAANSSALASKVTASSAASVAVSAKNIAVGAKNATEGFESSASASNSATLVSKASASGALVATNSSKDAALIAKNATTGFQATASAANSSALASKVTASSAAVSANSSKTLALQAKNAAEGFESTASAANSATLVSEASASGAAVSANSSKTLALQAKNAAEGFQATASAANSSALASKVTASSAAVSANSSKTLALQAKNATTGFESTASAANSATLVSQVTASGAAAVSISARDVALSAKNATTGYESTASASNSATLLSKAGASNAKAAAISAKNIAVSARNVATGAQATASAANSSALVSEASASGAVVAANSSKTLALQAKNAAEGFEATASAANSATLVSEASASGALVATNSSKAAALTAKNATTGFQATASAANSSALASKVTASSAAVSANSSKTLALQAKNATTGFESTASASNSATLVSKASASSAASVAVSAKNIAVSARNVTTGAQATASAANSSALASKVTASSAAVSANSSKTLALQAKNATTGFESSASSANSSAQASKVSASAALASTNSSSTAAIVSKNAASDFAAAASISKLSASSSASDIGALTSQVQDVRLLEARVSGGLNGHYSSNAWYLHSVGTSAYPAIVTPLESGGTIFIENLTDSTVQVVKQEALAFEEYNIPLLTTFSNSSGTYTPYKVYSTSSIVVKHARGSMGVPTNFSSDLLALRASRNYPTKATLFSPYTDTTVKVYVQTGDSSADANKSLTEGVSPVNHTFTISAGSVYNWSSADITGNFPSPEGGGTGADSLSVVFQADAKILGLTRSNINQDFKPLAPMSNAEVLATTNATLSYPRFVRGGGINTTSLKFALIAADDNLNTTAPNLYSKLHDSNGSHAYGDITSGEGINSSDANVLQSWISNQLPHSTSADLLKHTRILELIDYLDNNYSDLETTFVYSGTTYTLYDVEPLTTSDKSIDKINNVLSTSRNIRNYFSVSNIGDGAGGDSSIGLPIASLSDYYVWPSSTMTNYKVVSYAPNTVKVLKKDGTVLYTIDHSLASKANPLQDSQGTSSGSGADLGAGGGPYRFIGTNDFYLLCQNTDTKETTLLGARQGILSGEIARSAIATEVSAVSSTVDGHTTTISEQTQSINGIHANYSVKINNNGFVTGFGLSSTTSGSASSAFVVQADKFAIIDPQTYNSGLNLNPTAEITPFAVSGGVTTMNTAFIADLTSLNIKSGTITGDSISATSRLEVFTEGSKTTTYAALDGVDPTYRFYVGNSEPTLAPFTITTAGDVVAKSLSFKGIKGSYFDSKEGMGIAALSQITKFVQGGSITSESDLIIGQYSNDNDSSYASITLKQEANVYQKYRVSADDLGYRSEVQHFGQQDFPLQLTIPSGVSTQNLSNSNVLGPRRVSVAFQPDTYVYDVAINRALQVGEYVKVLWTSLPSNSLMSWLGMVLPSNGQSISSLAIGPGTAFSDSITVRVATAGITPLMLLTRPGQGNVAFTASNEAVDTPDVIALSRAEVPYEIELTPLRDGNAFAATSNTDDPFDAQGALTFTAIEHNGSFTSNVDYEYRVLSSSVSSDYNSLSANSYIDSRASQLTGAVDSSGYFTVWIQKQQSSPSVVPIPAGDDNSLSQGTYKFGLNLNFVSSNGGAPTTSQNNTIVYITKLIETEVSMRYDENYVAPSTVLKLEVEDYDDVTSIKRASIRSGHHGDGSTAYGLGFSGQSYTIIESNHTDWDSVANNQFAKQKQAIFLGNVSDDSGNTNKDNLLVVACKDDNALAYTQKFNLTSAGNLYLGANSSVHKKVAVELYENTVLQSSQVYFEGNATTKGALGYSDHLKSVYLNIGTEAISGFTIFQGNSDRHSFSALGDYTASRNILANGTISGTNGVVFQDNSIQTSASMAPYFHVSAIPEHNYTLPNSFKIRYDSGTLLGEFNYYSDGFIWQGVNEMQLSDENSVMYSMFVKNKNINAVTKTMKIANLDDRLYIYVNGVLSDSRTSGVAHPENWVDIDIVIEGANAGNGSGVSRIDLVKNDAGRSSNKFELIGIIIDPPGGDISWQPFNDTFTYWTMSGN